MNMPAYDYARAERTDRVSQVSRPRVRRAPRTAFASFVSRLAVVMAVILALGGLVFAQSMVTGLQVDIRMLKADIEAQHSLQSRLTEQIHTQNNINRIMIEAEGLGMGYPDADAVLYVEPDTEGVGVLLAGR